MAGSFRPLVSGVAGSADRPHVGPVAAGGRAPRRVDPAALRNIWALHRDASVFPQDAEVGPWCIERGRVLLEAR